MYGQYLTHILGDPTEVTCKDLSANVKNFNKYQVPLQAMLIIALIISTVLSIYVAASLHANKSQKPGMLLNITKAISAQNVGANVMAWLLWAFLATSVGLYIASLPKPPKYEKEDHAPAPGTHHA